MQSPDSLIISKYQAKEHLKTFYDKLVSEIMQIGEDIEIAPKNTYVSMRRKKQFAILNPATKTRFEIGINLKGQAPEGKLEAEKPNAMCSHKIALASLQEIGMEVLRCL